MTLAAGSVAGTAAAVAAAWTVRHRTAPPVRRWSPGRGERAFAGGLAVRTAGTAEHVTVLLHALITSGDTFGAGFDSLADASSVVVPDLLGFGRSSDADTDDHSLHAHLRALDAMLLDLGHDSAPLTIAGHSMGAALALHWAAHRGPQVRRVVTLAGALFPDRHEAARRLRAFNPAVPLIGMPSRFSRAVCTQLCMRRPRLTRWLYAAAAPELPAALARQCAQHTWPSYLGAMETIVLDPSWQSALGELQRAGVPVVLAVGGRDRLAVPHLARQLAQRHPNVEVVVRPDADHYLPLTHGSWCAGLLRPEPIGKGPPP